ncbi:hypothetical protein RIF29_23452 [Crotalaria pallida]|uniref:PIN domain-containing protein n=1 Tax=Crotalaria pallida TaxID=3830 RepID=A0AAN9I7G5_CROPI
MDLASFVEKHHAAVLVIPEESEFGCTVRDNDKAEDILTAEAIRILNSENTCLLAGEVIPDSKFHQIKNVEEVSTDSPPCGEKQDKGVAAVIVAPEESEFGCTIGDNDRIEDNITNGASIFNSENTSLLVKEVIPVTNFQQIHIVEEVGDNSISDGENQDTCGKEFEPKLQAQLADKFCHEQLNSLNEIVEDTGNKCAGSICPVSEWVESLNSLVSQEAVLEVTDEKENQTLQSLIAVAGCSDIESLESHVETKESGKYSHDQGLKVLETVEASEDIGNNCTGSISLMSVLVESVNSPVPQEADLRITNEKENQTPQSLIGMTGSSDIEVPESRVEATEKSCSNVWSRRGTAASAPQVRTRNSRFTSTHCYKKDIIHKTMSKDIFSVLDEKEIFTPNKENFSPNTLNLLFMRKKGELEGIKHSKSQRSQDSKSNFNFSPNIYSDERITAVSNKGNRSLKVTQEQKSRRKPLLECHMNLAQKQDTMDMKKNRVERIPFQSLMNSGSKSKSRTSGPVSAAKSIDWGQISDKLTKPSHITGGQKKSWIMVVDTASLLNKESRKALHLLQGLKGTRLIIPRLVIRELDNMKRQHFSIFRRTSQASLALEWIEECMENTEWWIHIQGAMEEHMLIAPTPPAASPRTQFVEDHILDLALLYRRTENDGQLVLLSDDVTLKIKSMAEGLLCETVQEFRQSLVNPFSERFVWANSSSRGLTWSCKDDVVLRGKYCGLPSKAGLKLFTEEFLYLPSKCNFSRL